jgi:hypothetical protein
MRPKFTLCKKTYACMLDALNSLYLSDKLGFSSDLKFIADDYWLGDTAVIDQVYLRRGLWEVHLVFAHPVLPMRFLKRRITAHSSPQRAAQLAFYMRRLAAKDQRGTISVRIEQFHLSLN